MCYNSDLQVWQVCGLPILEKALQFNRLAGFASKQYAQGLLHADGLTLFLCNGTISVSLLASKGAIVNDDVRSLCKHHSQPCKGWERAPLFLSTQTLNDEGQATGSTVVPTQEP